MGAVAADCAPGAGSPVTALEVRLAPKPSEQRLLAGFSAEGSEISAWRLSTGGAVARISVEALGERGRQLLDFHWSGGRLLSVRIRSYDYGAFITELPEDGPAPLQQLLDDEAMGFLGTRVTHWCGGPPGADKQAEARRAAVLRAMAVDFQLLMQTRPPLPAGESCMWECKALSGDNCRRYGCQ